MIAGGADKKSKRRCQRDLRKTDKPRVPRPRLRASCFAFRKLNRKGGKKARAKPTRASQPSKTKFPPPKKETEQKCFRLTRFIKPLRNQIF